MEKEGHRLERERVPTANSTLVWLASSPLTVPLISQVLGLFIAWMQRLMGSKQRTQGSLNCPFPSLSSLSPSYTIVQV